ncbi:HepT-like ribonuclease domain-containing protein [Parafrankia elaeagni]|uniref:HepT-like ribonuclease domain-containing protein n=1 Tax=Parafrankia elaeagni TaxID=222534 RepID=UPI000373949F|nr:HepT-like ribonuclease domain-containing protein [Parafrankia elaeagni]
MRRDELYLVDMIEAAVAATAFVQNVDEAAFLESDLIQSAVLQKLLVIGEAAGRVSAEIRGRWPDVPWRSVTGFRNIAVHAYFEVDWSIVWRIATAALREIHEKLLALLKAEFPLIASQLDEPH